MYVRQLAGRQAGMIVEMPATVAKAAIGQGTAEEVSDQEIHDDGFQAINRDLEVPPEQVMLGYRIEPALNGGFDLLDPGGIRLNKESEPYHNHPEARAAAIGFARRARGLPEVAEPVEVDGSNGGGAAGQGDGKSAYAKMTVQELQAEVERRKLDGSKANKKADWIALLERDDQIKVAIAGGDFDFLTVDELQKYAADNSIDLTGKTAKADLVAAVKSAKGIEKPAAN